MHHPFPQRLPARGHLPLARVPVGGENAPHLGHGLCQPAPARAPHRVLVLSLQSQLRPRRHLWQSPPRHRAGARGSRLLPHPAGRVPLDAPRQQRHGRVPRLRRRLP